uniref:Transmembrane protein n=1 Tax=Chromera velia CCMP2878 TaxID=1169474 RepID=A0A0G4HRA9_9ALVE|eukprot:Cvel_30624.t1-p1 / transcript=Cvel_30624.t1 / gene=Cvel_30624 / organism=Chromera_velia_CCMP2878 / gene_product=hypothetical protein / transcript_product=hypothetical protein / location=Cvel_scaffold4400:763-2366(+) / protein_length=456 / sequence_SO=supercontig / SO=protein_coding / is_pseudo=false
MEGLGAQGGEGQLQAEAAAETRGDGLETADVKEFPEGHVRSSQAYEYLFLQLVLRCCSDYPIVLDSTDLPFDSGRRGKERGGLRLRLDDLPFTVLLSSAVCYAVSVGLIALSTPRNMVIDPYYFLLIFCPMCQLVGLLFPVRSRADVGIAWLSVLGAGLGASFCSGTVFLTALSVSFLVYPSFVRRSLPRGFMREEAAALFQFHQPWSKEEQRAACGNSEEMDDEDEEKALQSESRHSEERGLGGTQMSGGEELWVKGFGCTYLVFQPRSTNLLYADFMWVHTEADNDTSSASPSFVKGLVRGNSWLLSLPFCSRAFFPAVRRLEERRAKLAVSLVLVFGAFVSLVHTPVMIMPWAPIHSYVVLLLSPLLFIHLTLPQVLLGELARVVFSNPSEMACRQVCVKLFLFVVEMILLLLSMIDIHEDSTPIFFVGLLMLRDLCQLTLCGMRNPPWMRQY